MGGFQNDPGTVQQESGFGFFGRFWTESFNNITAKAGGGISGATLVDSMFVSVTVTNPNDSVLLPAIAAFPGGALIICVQNISANSMQVFAQGSDTINGLAGSTGVSQMANSIAYYQCTKAGLWQATGLGVGFTTGPSASFPAYSTQTGVVAGTTHTQAGATPITAQQVQISTAAVNDGVRLPAAMPGMEVTIVNNGAGATCQVYATGSDTINGTAGSTGVTQATGAVTIYYCFVAGAWVTK